MKKRTVTITSRKAAITKDAASGMLNQADIEEITKELEGYICAFDSPESANIAGARYDPDTETMVITFKGGKDYAYNKFPEIDWRLFEEAPSKGKHFSNYIKPFWTGRAL